MILPIGCRRSRNAPQFAHSPPENRASSQPLTDAYAAFVMSVEPLPIAGSEVARPEPAPAGVLSLDGQWIEVTVSRNGPWLRVEDEGVIKDGMWGSPIVNLKGEAIGLVSTGGLNPVLTEALPRRLGLLPGGG
jgi:hypothetical protein